MVLRRAPPITHHEWVAGRKRSVGSGRRACHIFADPQGGEHDGGPLALHLVLHCLPGPMPARPRPSRTWRPSWRRAASSSAHPSSGPRVPDVVSRRVLAAFNRRGAFDNLSDSEAGLRPRSTLWAIGHGWFSRCEPGWGQSVTSRRAAHGFAW